MLASLALVLVLTGQTPPVEAPDERPAAPPAPAPATVAAPPAPTPTATPPPESSDERVLVLEPRGTVSEELRRLVANTLTVELAARPGLIVVSSADVKQLAALESDKQEAGCDDSGCLAELAGALGARYVIFGDATQLGELLVINLNLFDVRRGAAVQRVSLEVRRVEDLPGRVRSIADRLAPGSEAAGGAVVDESSGSGVLTWALVGTGVAVLAGGALFDALSSSSNDATLDGLDFVGPGLMLVGGGTAAAGLWMVLE